MATFSVGEAVGAGFRIIRANPTAIVAWGLAFFVIALAPMLIAAALFLPDFIDLSKQTPADMEASPEAFAAAMALQAKIMLFQAVQFVSTVAGAVVLQSAIFRAVLEPQEKRHWYLRLGPQEAWVAVVWLFAMMLFMVAIFVGMIPLGIAGVIISVVTQSWDVTSLGVLAILAVGAFGVVVWVGIRLALATPMSFAQRKFRMFESWALTRGHGRRMALTFFVVVGLVWMIELIVFVLFLVLGFAGLAASGMPLPWNQGPDAAMPAPPGGWGPFLLVLVPCAALLFSIPMAVVHTIAAAPLAYIYQQLTKVETAVTGPGT